MMGHGWWRRALGALTVALAAGIAGWLVFTVAPGAGRAAVSTAGFPSGPGEPGIFTERCAFSHEAADDPILMPGRAGQAMQHDFFGNVTTGASSTTASLSGGPTTCATSADSSAYWTPVLYRGARAITPLSALIYWRAPRRVTGAVHTIPAGLQMIAGDETATRPQGVDRVAWSCQSADPDATPLRTASPHPCPAGRNLKLTIAFPSCWDGHTLSGADQTDVVYPAGGACPASHPVQIPQILFHVLYPISGVGDLSLSMSPTMRGSLDTAHADFIDGWRAPVLARDVAACVAAHTRCGPVSGPQATPRGPHPAS